MDTLHDIHKCRLSPARLSDSQQVVQLGTYCRLKWIRTVPADGNESNTNASWGVYLFVHDGLFPETLSQYVLSSPLDPANLLLGWFGKSIYPSCPILCLGFHIVSAGIVFR